jgi:oxaloacetate decarboxylase (Na+ extruding) subunit alpha
LEKPFLCDKHPTILLYLDIGAPDMAMKKVEVTTLTFRDGPQSTGLWDDYFRLFEDARREWLFGKEGRALKRLTRIAGLVKESGFSGAEVFWGQSLQKYMLATINPFEAMEFCRYLFGDDFMLSGLGRGVNAAGFRPYGQDVIDVFVERFAERGGVAGKKLIKMRIFDALNNIHNCGSMVSAAIRYNNKALAAHAHNTLPKERRATGWQMMPPAKMIHIEAALCYQPEREYRSETLYSDEYYLEYARQLFSAAEDAGGKLDSLVIKDMAGQLDPARAALLVPKLTELGLPVYLHTHCTNYKRTIETIRTAAEVGIAGVETVEWPLSGGTSHASVRDVINGKEALFTTIDLDKLSQLEQELESLFGSKADLMTQDGSPKAKRLDLRVDEPSRLELWALGIPGGAMAAVMNLLQKDVCLHKKIELKAATAVFAAELEHLQNRIGWVPLVTPMADIVYTQAILNVIAGRNKIIEHRYAKMIVGLYGAHINHATGKRISIDDDTVEAVLDYCRKVRQGNAQTPSFGQSYPKPVVEKDHRSPAPEMTNARETLRPLLMRSGIVTDSIEADEAIIMNLMEPPASEGVTERILLRSMQGKIRVLLESLTLNGAAADVQPTDDVLQTIRDYGGAKRAEAVVARLIQSKSDLNEIDNIVSIEAQTLRRITSTRMEIEDVKGVISRFTHAVLEDSFLKNHAQMSGDNENLPFGPENGMYYFNNEIDPYSSESRRLLQEHWPREYENRSLSNAVRNATPFEGELIN